MVYYEKHELDDTLNDFTKIFLLNEQFDFFQKVLKCVGLGDIDKKIIQDRCDEIVEKKREIVDKLMNPQMINSKS